jgi:L-alanine-DL-glutamate epimerase-like enolase superfamily enzyme
MYTFKKITRLNMEVTSVNSFLVRSGGHQAGMTGEKIWLFVKVNTDEGIHGWGEAYTQLDRHVSIDKIVQEKN